MLRKSRPSTPARAKLESDFNSYALLTEKSTNLNIDKVTTICRCLRKATVDKT